MLRFLMVGEGEWSVQERMVLELKMVTMNYDWFSSLSHIPYLIHQEQCGSIELIECKMFKFSMEWREPSQGKGLIIKMTRGSSYYLLHSKLQLLTQIRTDNIQSIGIYNWSWLRAWMRDSGEEYGWERRRKGPIFLTFCQYICAWSRYIASPSPTLLVSLHGIP